jgi:ABC-2 type transport system ATP-binding protein
MNNKTVIHTESLTKHYGDVRAVVDLNLDIKAGEVFGFLGPNGAGKTTTIRTLLDEIRPTSGKATILGMDTHDKAVEIRRYIGYLPGDLAMYPNLTGKDTLTYFANLRGGVDWSYVNLLAKRLDADLNKKVGDLSSGNRQKVGLIQALMSKPQLLIMDEPSLGLDPLIQRELQKMMREVIEEGNTIFLSSHTLSEVQRVADRVGIIRHGNLVAVERVSELRSKAIRRIELNFSTQVDTAVFEAVPGVYDISVDDHRVMLSYEGKIEDLLRVAIDRYDLLDIHTQEADLEEIFLTYYRDEEVSS